jgi:hypothetical protein
MTYEELLNILRQNKLASEGVSQMGTTGLSINDIVSGIQSQYTPRIQQFEAPRNVGYGGDYSDFFRDQRVNVAPSMLPTVAQPQGSFGANRFIDPSVVFKQDEITPYGAVAQAAGPTFVPSDFNADIYKNIDPKKLSDLISTIETGGSSSSDAASFSRSVDDAGLATAPNISSLGVGIGATLLGLATGLPLGLVASLVGRQNIANTMNNASNRSAAQFNRDIVAAQSGLSNTPENAAALASMIDSLSAANQTTQAATMGATGTGGQAAQAAAQAAETAQALGLSEAQQAQAAQAAANSVISGMSVSQAVESATSGLGGGFGDGYGTAGGVSGIGVGSSEGINSMDASSDSYSGGYSDSGGYSSSDSGGYSSSDSGSDSSSSSGGDGSSSSGDGSSSGGDGSSSGGDSGSSSGSDSGSSSGGDGGYAKGGKVTRAKLKGRNPKGKDDGYAALDAGEYVIQKSAVDMYGDEIFSLLNDRKISKKKLQSLL